MLDSSEFIATIRQVVGDDERVGLHEPDITELEHQYVAECLTSTFVSSVGPFVTQFESEIAAFTGAKHAVAVSNGTSALHVALVLAGVKPNDEVLIPALTFVATANAVSHAGGIPHFVDSDIETLGMCPNSLRSVLEKCIHNSEGVFNPETGRTISAVVPMHTIGHPLNMDRICQIAAEFNLAVVEDSAESLGSYIGNKHTGTFGKLGILSFNGNKTITTGGGGMVLTDDDELAYQAKHLTTTAKTPHPWLFKHDQIAWNFRLPNLNAAMGVAQLSRLPQFLEEKRLIAQRYIQAFDSIDGIHIIQEPSGTTSNYWLCSVILDEDLSSQRDQLILDTNEAGIQTRPLWDLLNTLPMYRDNPSAELVNAKSLQSRVISLPSSPVLART